MTLKYNNVYINSSSTVTGPYEARGPLGNYFDLFFEDLYFNKKSWEQAESYLIEEAVRILLTKEKTKKIDVHISGDLLNQLTSSNYAAAKIRLPFLGVYSACATSVEGMIVGANMIESNQINNCLCTVSSHNNSAEKQFRNPVEYGGPKPKTATFTVTGSTAIYLSNKKSNIKIESSTIGIVNDANIKDAFHMGAVMAPAAVDTLYRHLIDLNRNVNYYDLILTGDLGLYGKSIFKELLKQKYNIEIKNYDDTATMIYDLNNQPVYAGGSGPACAPLVLCSYIFDLMKNQKLKKVLLLATGALHSPATVNQKLSIPSIAHAISLEAL